MTLKPCMSPQWEFASFSRHLTMTVISPIFHWHMAWNVGWENVSPCMLESNSFFAESLSTFVHDLNCAKPTLFVSVPCLWTKFQQGVYKKMPPTILNTLLKITLLNILI